MNETAQLFEIDAARRFRKFWDSLDAGEKAEVYSLAKEFMGDAGTQSLSKKQLNDQAEEVIKFLNEKSGSRYRFVEVHMKMIRARLESGITVQELKSIVAMKSREWKGTDQEQFLRPATLFCPTRCENYLGSLGE